MPESTQYRGAYRTKESNKDVIETWVLTGIEILATEEHVSFATTPDELFVELQNKYPNQVSHHRLQPIYIFNGYVLRTRHPCRDDILELLKTNKQVYTSELCHMSSSRLHQTTTQSSSSTD